MSLEVGTNPYRGVNAHLHSGLQSKGGNWQSFHDAYIVYLTEVVAALLPSGYDTLNVESLHSWEDLEAVVIYINGVPVTRLELLSPGNKPFGAHYSQYVVKRDDTLLSGINLVEIDFLHEQPSPVKVIPSYPDHKPNSAPYIILVSDPHPEIEEGRTELYPFHVDDPIPTVRIPLIAPQSIIVDFGAVYERTFSSNPYYAKLAGDYSKMPVRFETYSAEDQARIQQRMSLIHPS